MNVSIRLCTKEEIPLVGEFYDDVVKYLTEHINYPRWMYKEYPSTPFVQQMTEIQRQFVCCDGDTIVGAFVLDEDKQNEYTTVKWSVPLQPNEYLVCHALATAVPMQGRGIGKQIVQFCIDYAKQHGYKAIRLDVVPDNYPAKKLYEGFGFRFVGDYDLGRGYEHIPLFSLYELNL